MDRIQVFALTLPYSENEENDSAILLYNVSVPAEIIRDPIRRRNVLERVGDFLAYDFGPDAQISYQITATYYLINTIDQTLRLWSGSFFTRENNPNLVQDFRRFNAQTFVEQAFAGTENVEAKVQWRGLDTNWQFDSLQTVVISAQCKVGQNSAVLRRRNLRAKKNKTTSFALP